MMRPKRKAIPKSVKSAVLIRQSLICPECGCDLGEQIEFDHRPALILRSVVSDGTEYFPAQNDPLFIEALHADCHLKRTVGRVIGAEKTVTIRGSDIWLAKKFRKLEGRPRRKQKIASRPFPKTKRPFRSKHV